MICPISKRFLRHPSLNSPPSSRLVSPSCRAYLAGSGKASICRSMLPNMRRVRWFRAGKWFMLVGGKPVSMPPAHDLSPHSERRVRHEVRRSAARRCSRIADLRPSGASSLQPGTAPRADTDRQPKKGNRLCTLPRVARHNDLHRSIRNNEPDALSRLLRNHAGHRTDHQCSTLFPVRPEPRHPTEVQR